MADSGTWMRRMWIAPVLLGALVLTACGGGGDNDAEASGNTGGLSNVNISGGPTATPATLAQAEITVGDNTFEPANLTIKAGTKVTWKWTGAAPHSVLIQGVKSPEQTGSGTFEKTFEQGGQVFNYQCGVHGASMAGKITVE